MAGREDLSQILSVDSTVLRKGQTSFRREHEASSCALIHSYTKGAILYEHMAFDILVHAKGCIRCSVDMHI